MLQAPVTSCRPCCTSTSRTPTRCMSGQLVTVQLRCASRRRSSTATAWRASGMSSETSGISRRTSRTSGRRRWRGVRRSWPRRRRDARRWAVARGRADSGAARSSRAVAHRSRHLFEGGPKPGEGLRSRWTLTPPHLLGTHPAPASGVEVPSREVGTMRVFSTSYVRRALGIVALPVIALPLTSSVAGAARTHLGTQTQVIVSHDVHHDTSPALRSLHPAHNAAQAPHVVRQGRHAAPSTSHRFAAPDTSGSRHSALNIPSASQNFEGITDLDGVIPPDNDGAVGTSQYVELVNSHLAVYTKAGATVLGPETTNTLFSGFGGGCQSNNDGDGTILFDTISQRWVIQQFSVTTTPYLDCVAVSTSSDATGTWNRYSFPFSNFPDYPKTGVWPDAYYATFNLFNSAGTQGLGSEVCAFNRASMLTGAAAASQCVMPTASGETTLLPATIDGTTQPAAGTPERLVAISPTAANSVAYWRCAGDRTTPSNP